MPSLNENRPTKRYWQSLEEYASTGEFMAFVESEFPTEAESLHPTTRRRFLQLMGASLSLAGLTACRWPQENIVPYANRPDDTIPGRTEQYATAMELGGVAEGLLVTSYDGRPIKVEGNPSDPISRGSTRAWAQAAILELYDPDRSKTALFRQNQSVVPKTFADFQAFIQEHFTDQKNQFGRGLYFLSEASSSSSVQRMKDRIRAVFPDSKWFEYEPLCNHSKREGSDVAFGIDLRPHYRLDRARVILSLDADFLGAHPAALQLARDFAQGRRVEQEWMNRLYTIESHFTITGAMADHRLPMQAAAIERFALALAAELLVNQGVASSTDYQPLKNELNRFLASLEHHEMIQVLARDLAAHRGESVILVGAGQSPFVHTLAHLLNEALDNVGKERSLYYTVEDRGPIDELASITELAGDVQAGKVDTLVILGGNPVYDAPADLKFSELLASIPTAVHLSLYDNETSRRCAWHVPRAHFLESWGDARGYDWHHCAIQPLIEPLYAGLSVIELLAALAGDPMQRGYDIVRQAIREIYFDSDATDAAFETFWRRFLHDGVTSDNYHREKHLPLDLAKILNLVRQASDAPEETNPDHLELVFVPDSKMWDGRFANNAWLQELPDFLSKLAWDNAAFISPATAQARGIQSGDVVQLQYRGQSMEIAAYVLPGQPEDSIALPLGYGRTVAGNVGNGVGFNTYHLRTSQAMFFDQGAVLEPTGRTYSLATTQDHFASDALGLKERQSRVVKLIREADLAEYREHPDFAKHVEHEHAHAPLWQEIKYDGSYRWGMAIDLNSCIGCNACVTACQAENNIPVVGKEQVRRGREMQWIRIDRYFQGSPDAPEVVQQPLACVQCENAPCEQVCPVAATTHDHDGLNVMVYNRCIGTRYCSNNCPFKVRRFNFFNYHKHESDLQKMVYNPEVTVRSRGVMEKCTYCVQRIQAAKIVSRNERRTIQDGDVITACAQACPTKAITFGDLNDQNSAVSQFHQNSRSYTQLDELNLKPRTAYLARVRNPNPEWTQLKHDRSKSAPSS